VQVCQALSTYQAFTT